MIIIDEVFTGIPGRERAYVLAATLNDDEWGCALDEIASGIADGRDGDARTSILDLDELRTSREYRAEASALVEALAAFALGERDMALGWDR